MFSGVRAFFVKHTGAEWLIPAALCAIMLGQMLLSVRQMSQQADEAIHLYAGYRVLKCSDYAFGREHPPLAKMIAAAPLLWSNPPMDCSQRELGADEEDQATHWLYSQQDWWPLLMKARIASSLSAVALCLGVWIAARRIFGRMVALVSTAVLAFEPNILAHGALLLNNVLLAAMFLLTVFCFYCWTRERSEPMLLGTGFCLGLALLTKHSAVLLIPILLVLAVADTWMETGDKGKIAGRAWRKAGALALIGVIAAGTIWGCYGIRYSQARRRGSNSLSAEQLEGMTSPDVQVLKAMRAAHVLPQPYLDGVIEVRTMITSAADVVEVLGKPYRTPPWFFFPLVVIIKFTLAFLAILALGGAGISLAGKERRREFVFLLLPVVLFLAASVHVQRTGIGIWHLFPTVPFLVIAAAAGCVMMAQRYRGATWALGCLLLIHAGSSLHAYPNYLSYANEAWGGPQKLYKRLPWTDLGQSYWEVSKYMAQHPNTPCWIDSDWRIAAASYRIPCTQMGNHWEAELPTHMNGIVFLSSSWLAVDGHPGNPLASFHELEPKALLSGSAMAVYEGEFDTRLTAARALNNRMMRLLRSGNNVAALPLAAAEVELGGAAPFPHYFYCLALASNGYAQPAMAECSIAMKLARTYPDGQPPIEDVEQIMAAISQASGLPIPSGAE